MHGGADRAYTLLTRREQAVVEALLADQSPEEIAARFRTSVRSIKADVIAIYRKQRLRAVQASMAEYRDRQIEWLDENRLLTMRRMLGSADAAGLHLHLLAALRAWTGAGQAAFWEIREGSGGLRVRSAAGIEYPVRGDGIVPTLAVRPVAIIRSALLANEEWAPVAGSEAASAVDGELLALRLTHGSKRWMALLADLPEGKVHHAAAASAEALVGMASLVAASFPEALPRATCGAVERGYCRTPGPVAARSRTVRPSSRRMPLASDVCWQQPLRACSIGSARARRPTAACGCVSARCCSAGGRSWSPGSGGCGCSGGCRYGSSAMGSRAGRWRLSSPPHNLRPSSRKLSTATQNVPNREAESGDRPHPPRVATIFRLGRRRRHRGFCKAVPGTALRRSHQLR